jgi:hypothetical protein
MENFEYRKNKTKLDTCVVVEIFNNVAWAKSSILLEKPARQLTEELVEDSFQVFIPNIGFKISN